MTFSVAFLTNPRLFLERRRCSIYCACILEKGPGKPGVSPEGGENLPRTTSQRVAKASQDHPRTSRGDGWAGLGWAGLGWAGVGWAGLGWARLGLGRAGSGRAGLGWAGLG